MVITVKYHNRPPENHMYHIEAQDRGGSKEGRSPTRVHEAPGELTSARRFACETQVP